MYRYCETNPTLRSQLITSHPTSPPRPHQVILILVAGNNGASATPVPSAAMWSPILVAVALLAGPFWFTPFFFRLSQVVRDTREFRSWVSGSGARGVPDNWSEWNAGQLATLRDDAHAQVPRYRFWSTCALVLPRAAISILSAIVAITGAHFETPGVPDLVWVCGGSVAAWVLLGLWGISRRSYLSSGLVTSWRWFKGIVQVSLVLFVCFLIVVGNGPGRWVRLQLCQSTA
jgi:1,3-beta-glucan synthase